jgi:hypothetical protein
VGARAEYLSNMGITKENVKGYGKNSKMKIPKEIRHRFDKQLKELCDNRTQYLELIGCARARHLK